MNRVRPPTSRHQLKKFLKKLLKKFLIMANFVQDIWPKFSKFLLLSTNLEGLILTNNGAELKMSLYHSWKKQAKCHLYYTDHLSWCILLGTSNSEEKIQSITNKSTTNCHDWSIKMMVWSWGTETWPIALEAQRFFDTDWLLFQFTVNKRDCTTPIHNNWHEKTGHLRLSSIIGLFQPLFFS